MFEIIGHRGFPEVAPENTLVSFAKAIAAGATMVECDVTLTKDGHVVVMHDDDLHRTTDGHGLVNRVTLQEIQSLSAGKWFSPEFVSQKVPTLPELLELVKGKCRINIEIKGSAVGRVRQEIEEKVVSEVRRHNLVDHTVVSSFDWRAVNRVKILEPGIEGALLFWRAMLMTPAYYKKSNQFDALHFNLKKFKRKYVDLSRRIGVKTRVYTVNSVEEAKWLRDLGVDGVFTDRVSALVDGLKLQA